MLRKIFRTGNSIVVSIPKDILDQLELSEGEDVSVELDMQQNGISFSAKNRELEKFTLCAASSKAGRSEITKWLKKHSHS
jgi:antitoxin component of MazEF toxin-antitoxin module